MIPNATAVAEVESTFAGEDIDMEIDQNSLAHLMGVLSDIYSNPTMAVVREYTVNAIDSHVEAGNPDPVKITLPNAFSPNLIIQDFGIGMGADDVRNVYSKYGASTKRLSDTVSGMLGIGAKSAFAYSNGFLVTAVKDGKRIHVSVNRSEDGGGVMTVLAESDTKEPNGVTISIPVRDSYEMKNAVSTFCSFLEPGKVLVDGKDLSQRDTWELITSDVKDANGDVVVEHIWRVPNNTGSKVIMGNVPYDPTEPISPSYGVSIYAQVVMGKVAFEPSRESLKDSALTRSTQELILEAYREILTEQISKEIAAAPDKPAARKAMNDLKAKMVEVGVTNLKYKGEDVPTGSQFGIKIDQGEPSVTIAHINSNYGNFSTGRRLAYDAIDGYRLVITGAPEHNRPGPVFRQRIVNYMKRVHNVEANYSYINVMLLNKNQKSLVKGDWYDLTPITVDWSVLKKEYVDRTRIGGGGISTAGKHFVIQPNGSSILQEVDNEEEILYVVGTQVREKWDLGRYTGHSRPRRYSPYDKAAMSAFMAKVRKIIDDDITIIDVYANRLEKFLRDHENAKELTLDMVSAKIEAGIVEQVTDGDILSSLRLYGISETLLALMPDEDDDVQMLRAIGTGDGGSVKKVKLAKGFGNKDFDERYEKVSKQAESTLTAVQKRYPLVYSLSTYIRHEQRETVRKHLRIEFLESKEDNDDAV